MLKQLKTTPVLRQEFIFCKGIYYMDFIFEFFTELFGEIFINSLSKKQRKIIGYTTLAICIVAFLVAGTIIIVQGKTGFGIASISVGIYLFILMIGLIKKNKK